MIAFSTLLAFACTDIQAQEDNKVREPLYRVGNSKPDAGFASATTTSPLAPIDRALSVAEDGLDYIRTDIRDYAATMIKRERVNGVVGDPEFIDLKVRNRREQEGVPFSIYMKFLKPSKVKGREVIWVEGRNSGKLIAHEGTGMFKHITASLDPDGAMAMRGNRYPIYEAGIENLVYRLIEKGQRDKQLGDAEVKFFENTKINGRKCTLIQVKHPEARPEYDFHICRVFIDDELKVPVRYSAYDWPEAEGEKPALMEEYTYLDMKLNVNLTENDFNPENNSYKFR
jgi:hypothetical protein